MKRLLTLKQALSTLEALDFAASDVEDESFDLEDVPVDKAFLWKFAKQQGLEPNELLELLADAQMLPQDVDLLEEGTGPVEVDDGAGMSKPPKKKRKTSSETVEELGEGPSKPKAKPRSKPQSPKPVFDLVEPEFVSSSSSKHKPSSSFRDALGDTFGEASQLDYADAADKNARKKSLRFHTAKIESASARRQGARNQAIGGDDDIPYRERRRERDAKLIKEAAKRGNEGGADLDDEDPETPSLGSKRNRESDDEETDADDGGDGYYELVKKQNKEKKEKKAEYEEMRSQSRYVGFLDRIIWDLSTFNA